MFYNGTLTFPRLTVHFCFRPRSTVNRGITFFSLFENRTRNDNRKLLVPEVKLFLFKKKNNFVFQASCIFWDELFHIVLNKCPPNDSVLIVPGSAKDSDLSISIEMTKFIMRDVLLNTQIVDPQSDLLGWS